MLRQISTTSYKQIQESNRSCFSREDRNGDYNKDFEKQFKSNAKKLLLSDTSHASKSKQFISKCYILDKLDDKSVITTIEKYKHPNCSVYIHDLENAKLIKKKEKEGRIVSAEGTSLLERMSYSILRHKT